MPRSLMLILPHAKRTSFSHVARTPATPRETSAACVREAMQPLLQSSREAPHAQLSDSSPAGASSRPRTTSGSVLFARASSSTAAMTFSFVSSVDFDRAMTHSQRHMFENSNLVGDGNSTGTEHYVRGKEEGDDCASDEQHRGPIHCNLLQKKNSRQLPPRERFRNLLPPLCLPNNLNCFLRF